MPRCTGRRRVRLAAGAPHDGAWDPMGSEKGKMADLGGANLRLTPWWRVRGYLRP